MNPLVAVVIPCCNYEVFLAECLLSLSSQAYRPLSIIVVHDGCGDGLILAGDLVQQLYSQENHGVSWARNRGLDEMGDAKYVWFLDADDMALPGGIEVRVDFLEKHPDVDMVWGNALKINVDRKNWDWGYNACMDHITNLERYSRRLNAQTLLWRREVFAQFGGYYEGLRSKEDKELLFRLGLHPDSPFEPRIKARRIKDDIAIYRRHPGAKHKKRMADPKWVAECERVFADRMKQLKREGITRDNTRFPVWP